MVCAFNPRFSDSPAPRLKNLIQSQNAPINPQPDQAFMTPAPIKETIAFDVLDRIDVRVGTIVRVEEVPGSEKLVRLIVDFGDHTRRVLAGLKQERADPGEIEGRQALFVVNLAPKKMMGEVSEAMLFDIGYADGVVPVLAVPEAPIPNGARAG